MIVFWAFMLIMDLVIPLSMAGFGKMFMKGGPEEINTLFGYRTVMSMKNRDTWEFAHKYCGRIWLKLGLILLPVSVIPLLFAFNKDIEAVAVVGLIVMFVQLIPMLLPIAVTEAALKKTFDENGVRKLPSISE